MFKKKIKKQQGVLQLQEEKEQNSYKGEGSGNAQKQGSGAINGRQQTSTGHMDREVQKTQTNKNQQIEASAMRGDGSLQEKLKRGKNPDDLYVQDAHQNMENEPKRKQKESFGPQKSRTGISSSTMTKNEETSRQVHQAFKDIAYQAGTSLIKDMGLQQDELQEETAKRRYMQNIEKTKLIKDGKMSTKVYRGMNAYANHKLTENDIKNAEEAYKKKMGPSRLNSTIKNSCRFDYVLNLCKDWHDSGYCPFGNSCLYLHDRSNYKTGWELEKDFEEQERQRWRRINNPDVAKKEDRQKLLKTVQKYKPPENCQICQQKFKSPVQVECGHIFCTSCAVKMLKCRTCGKRLSGIMNSAGEKLASMAKSYEQMVAKLQVEQEETQQKRRKFEHVSSLDVFAD